jgi:hypothetical protein
MDVKVDNAKQVGDRNIELGWLDKKYANISALSS